METSDFVTPIITLVFGGGLGWLFTVKYTRKEAEADAMQHFQSVYQGLIKDLQNDRENLKKEIQTLKDQQKEDSERLQRLEEGQRKNAKLIASLIKMACVKAPDCPDCVLINLSQFYDQ